MPCRLHAILLRQNGDFSRRREATHLRKVAPNVIDQALLDQRLPFVRAIEELAHGYWRVAVLPNLVKVIDIFWRKRIFDEEHVELFRLLTKLNALIWRKALVHIMDEPNFFAQLFPANFQHFQAAP